MFQWSFSLAFIMLTRLVVCGTVISLILSIASGVIVLLTSSNFEAFLVFTAYIFLFMMMLIFISGLYTIHRKGIWKSASGCAILVAQTINALVVYGMFFLFNIKQGM